MVSLPLASLNVSKHAFTGRWCNHVLTVRVEVESIYVCHFTHVCSRCFLFAIHSHRAILLYSTFEYIVVEPRMISIADICGALARVSRTAHISELPFLCLHSSDVHRWMCTQISSLESDCVDNGFPSGIAFIFFGFHLFVNHASSQIIAGLEKSSHRRRKESEAQSKAGHLVYLLTLCLCLFVFVVYNINASGCSTWPRAAMRLAKQSYREEISFAWIPCSKEACVCYGIWWALQR